VCFCDVAVANGHADVVAMATAVLDERRREAERLAHCELVRRLMEEDREKRRRLVEEAREKRRAEIAEVCLLYLLDIDDEGRFIASLAVFQFYLFTYFTSETNK